MRFLLVFISLTSLTACCKQLCADEPLVIQLKDFPPPAIDTVLLTRYAVGDSFHHPIDSAMYYPLAKGADSAAPILLINVMPFRSDEYKLSISGYTQTWEVKNISSGSAKCPCGGGNYRIITSCVINDNQQTQKPFLVHP